MSPTSPPSAAIKLAIRNPGSCHQPTTNPRDPMNSFRMGWMGFRKGIGAGNPKKNIHTSKKKDQKKYGNCCTTSIVGGQNPEKL